MGIQSVSTPVQAVSQVSISPKAGANGGVTAAQGQGTAAAAALKAVSAAVQEATESPSQTMQEAASGDRQAQKLLHRGAGAPASGLSHLGNHVDTKV